MRIGDPVAAPDSSVAAALWATLHLIIDQHCWQKASKMRYHTCGGSRWRLDSFMARCLGGIRLRAEVGSAWTSVLERIERGGDGYVSDFLCQSRVLISGAHGEGCQKWDAKYTRTVVITRWAPGTGSMGLVRVTLGSESSREKRKKRKTVYWIRR